MEQKWKCGGKIIRQGQKNPARSAVPGQHEHTPAEHPAPSVTFPPPLSSWPTGLKTQKHYGKYAD